MNFCEKKFDVYWCKEKKLVFVLFKFLNILNLNIKYLNSLGKVD